MEVAGLLIILFLIIAFVMIRNASEAKKKLLRYKEYLRTEFGRYEPKEYKNDEFERNASLFLNQPEKEFIDDITWHDFGMDDVYKKIDQTLSASGAEYLYWLLRSPDLGEDYRNNLNSDIDYFQKNETQRVETQMALFPLGRINKFSLYDYLQFLETLGKRNNTRQWIGLVLFIISVVLIFVNTSIGIFALLAMMSIQLVTYLKEKAVVEPFIASFAYIMRMITAANGFSKYTDKVSNYDSLQDNLKELKNFSKGYNFLFRLNSSTGSLADILVDYFKMMTHIDLIQFNNTLNQVKLKEENIIELSKQVGYIDAIISIASFRESLPYYCVPEFSKEEIFTIEEGFHPLINNPISNSFSQEKGMLVTGSNASGKSTFLRMTGINALLGQTIMTCCAKKYVAPDFTIYSSMSLQDNLIGGDSYYMVEIKSLKRILDAIESNNSKTILCFVDEVLRGTNTVERIAASTQILENLAAKKVFCFAATHDIELTSLLEERYDNYHFEEEVLENDVHFSYHLLDGKARTRNAIKLLQIIGFSDDIINHAEAQAMDFLNTGEWHVC